MTARATRACLIMNPQSGRGGVDLSPAYTVLQAHGWEVTVQRKLHGGHATELARQAVRDGYNVVVDCGGDGTLNEIVEGVVGTDAAVGTLPGGTANLWAHEMGISRQLGVAALQLVGAERRRVDVGSVSVNGQHKAHFILMAGLGFDAAVLEHLSKPLKNRIGAMAYVPAALGALPAFHAVPVRADFDDIHWHGKVSQVVVGNTRQYGGFTRATPTAFVDDGLLDVCLIAASRPLSVAKQLGSLLVRQRPSPASAQSYRAARITLWAPIVLPLQVDGGSVTLDDDELTADGVRYDFSTVAQGVCVLIPRTYEGELFQPSRFSHTLVDIPLRPVGPKAVESNGHANGRLEGKTKRWQVKVLAVGVDSITAARVKDGRVVRVIVDEHTVLADADGEERALWGALSSVTEGHRLKVEGHKAGEQGLLAARRVQLLDERPKKSLKT